MASDMFRRIGARPRQKRNEPPGHPCWEPLELKMVLVVHRSYSTKDWTPQHTTAQRRGIALENECIAHRGILACHRS